MEWPWTKARRQADAELLGSFREIVSGLALGNRTSSSSGVLEAALLELRKDLVTEIQATADLRAALDRLEIAVAYGIEHEDRRERRIEATVRRARAKLAEHGLESAGLEAEFEGLSIVDGGGGAEGRVPAVRGAVEEGDGSAPSSVKGVSLKALQRARGLI